MLYMNRIENQINLLRTVPVGSCIPMMVFMFDLMFISVITVKMIMFIAMFNLGPMAMTIPIMYVNYLLKKEIQVRS